MFWIDFSKAAIKEECQAPALVFMCMYSLLETLQHMELFILPECPHPQWVCEEEGHISQAACPAPLDLRGTMMRPNYKLSSFCTVPHCTQFYLPTQMGSSMEKRLSFRYMNMHRQGLHTKAQPTSQHLGAHFPIDSQHYQSQDKSGSLKVSISRSSDNVSVIASNFSKSWLQ